MWRYVRVGGGVGLSDKMLLVSVIASVVLTIVLRNVLF